MENSDQKKKRQQNRNNYMKKESDSNTFDLSLTSSMESQNRQKTTIIYHGTLKPDNDVAQKNAPKIERLSHLHIFISCKCKEKKGHVGPESEISAKYFMSFTGLPSQLELPICLFLQVLIFGFSFSFCSVADFIPTAKPEKLLLSVSFDCVREGAAVYSIRGSEHHGAYEQRSWSPPHHHGYVGGAITAF